MQIEDNPRLNKDEKTAVLVAFEANTDLVVNGYNIETFCYEYEDEVVPNFILKAYL